MRFFKSR